MFDNVGWGEILVLLVAGLFILGPERLPEAAAWLGRTIRQVRDFASGARNQLKQELGPEFDQLRKPLDELREPLRDLRGLRDLDPRRAVMRSLLDDQPGASGLAPSNNGSGAANGFTSGLGIAGSTSAALPPTAPKPVSRPLTPGEAPPIDPDAT